MGAVTGGNSRVGKSDLDVAQFHIFNSCNRFLRYGRYLNLTFDRLIIPIKHIGEVKLNASFSFMG